MATWIAFARVAEAGPACERRTQELAAWLAELGSPPRALPLPASLVPAPAAVGSPLPPTEDLRVLVRLGPDERLGVLGTVAAGPGAWIVGSDRVDRLDDLQGRVNGIVTATLDESGLHVGDPGFFAGLPPGAPWALAVDAGAAWSDVSELLDVAARNGHPDVDLVLLGPLPTAEPPPRSPTLERVRAALRSDAWSRGQELAALVRETFAPCPSMLAWFPTLGSLSPEETARAVPSGVAAALQGCGCAPDDDAVRAVWWGLLGPEGSPPLVAVRLRVTEARALGAALGALQEPWSPWSQALPALLAASENGVIAY